MSGERSADQRAARKAHFRHRHNRRYARIGGRPVYTKRMLREAYERATEIMKALQLS